MKKVITVKIANELDKQLVKHVVNQGYGMRGKSKWIEEAIEKFIQYSDFPSLVEVASESTKNDKAISMRLSQELLLKIEKAIVQVRTVYPALEGVQSNIVRASIYQALLR